MAVFDTGLIDNTGTPRTTQLSIRLVNTGRFPALAGVEVYHVDPTSSGFNSQTLYVVNLVSLSPFSTPGSGFTLDNVFANVDVFGVRVITSGLGGNDIAVTVLKKGVTGQIIDPVLEGEFAHIAELLFAYVANFSNSTVSVINTGTNTIVATVTLPAGSIPLGIAITPDGSRAYVANGGNSTVTVINTGTNTIVATVTLPAGSGPDAIAITPDGSRAYVANGGNSTVTVINTGTNTIVATVTLPAGSGPSAIAITPDGSRAYTANSGNSTVSVINTGTNTIVATVTLPAGSIPLGIAITPDGSRAYVANNGNSTFR
ncbi:beta-propeller fold lactonase family protein [Paenibacillus filicis]|uniref:Beta-propeller fold lactonase family protein n=1 Tax=Paenibacillus gyeongsangnamensis TaxID=3388067 RepID=A0ABT4QKA9_9BACL|nr:beta-propeller fold lactonase family protein [Paenibacillus filicis]MCZ8517313.1 beta-propeller fold lactonase family protein [Paenibacillus filicis]